LRTSAYDVLGAAMGYHSINLYAASTTICRLGYYGSLSN
jgi:hypothetical protein